MGDRHARGRPVTLKDISISPLVIPFLKTRLCSLLVAILLLMCFKNNVHMCVNDFISEFSLGKMKDRIMVKRGEDSNVPTSLFKLSPKDQGVAKGKNATERKEDWSMHDSFIRLSPRDRNVPKRRQVSNIETSFVRLSPRDKSAATRREERYVQTSFLKLSPKDQRNTHDKTETKK